MAEEILLITVKLQSDSKNAKTINDLIAANKELAKAIKDAPREGAEGYADLAETLDEAKKQFTANKVEIDKFNKELNTGVKNVEANKTSLVGLSKTLKDLEKEYKLLSAEERNTAKGRELEKSIFATRQELLKAEKKLGDFRRQVGNYGLIVSGLSPQLSALGSSVGTLVSGFSALSLAFKNSGAAAKAFLLALGPISIAIAGLSFALSKFESVRESFERGFAGMAAAGNVVVERIGQIAFSFKKLLEFDFSGFADGLAGAFKGLVGEIKNDFTAASEEIGKMQQLEEDEINKIVELAGLQRDVSNAKLEAEELSVTNRREAAIQIEKAIDLTKKQFDIEVDFARRRAEILAEQAVLKGETISDNERRAVEEARANLLRLEAASLNETKGLQKRLNQLRKVVKDESSALQALQQKQSDLTNVLKLQILAGQDTNETLKELTETTLKLLQVDEKFKVLTEGVGQSTNFTAGSLQSYNKELETQNAKLETLVIGSKEYEETQNLILQIEAKRSAAIGDITKNIEELNFAQEKNILFLEDQLTELRLRADAQKDIEASSGNVDAKISIEKRLNEALIQIRLNRILDEKASLETELQNLDDNLKEEIYKYEDNELKRQEISIVAQLKKDEIQKRSLELEKELLQIGLENYTEAEAEKTKTTKEQEAERNKFRDLAIQTTISAGKEITQLLGVLQKQATEKQLKEINTREQGQLNEAELLGKTEAQKQAIRDKFAAEREAIERKAAAERKAIALGEAIIDIAGAVLNSLNTAAPANFGLAITAGILGALQLATIAATNFADGGLVKPIKIKNGRILDSPNIAQMQNGDNILATVKTDEVVLNKPQQDALGGDETFRRIKVPGFGTGGKIGINRNLQSAFPFASGGIVPSFRTSPLVVRAFSGGGAVSAQNPKQMVKAEKDSFFETIYTAVRDGAALGAKIGTENADIIGKIAKQNIRDARRTKNEGL